MDEIQIFSIIKNVIIDILSHLENQAIKISDSLKELGANSIDRAEILIRTMSELQIKIPLVKFAQAKNIEEIVLIFLAGMNK